MKTQNQSLLRSGRTWASTLVATLLTVTAFTASAKDQVPYRKTWSNQTISRETHDDGSYDLLQVGKGNVTHGGKYTAIVMTTVEGPAGFVYDPESHSLLVPYSGHTTHTVANGDTVDSSFIGFAIVPLDADGNPLPPPYQLEQTVTINGGTGRFAGVTGHAESSGIAYADDSTAGFDVGVISTVGSNKKK